MVRRIGQPVLSAQQASVAREAAREGTVCAKTLLRTLLSTESSPVVRSCADRDLPLPSVAEVYKKVYK